MLQLKHLRYLSDMTGVPFREIKPLKFGYSIHWSIVTTYTLASQQIPQNTALAILRTQSYLVNIDDTASDFQFYRTVPEGVAWWVLARDTGTSIQDWTNQNAPSQLALDSDELILFPAGKFANLQFTPTAVAPTGTWQIRTTIYAYFIPPHVVDIFALSSNWINVQQ